MPGWRENVKPHKDKALLWHSIWKDNGRPATGLIADIRRDTRRKYHNALRANCKLVEKAKTVRMAEACLNDDKRDFWVETRKMFGSQTRLPQIVDGATGVEEIMHLFKRKYNDLYNSVSYDSARMDILKQTLETRISMNSFSNCLYCQSHYVTTDEVKRAVISIKPNKKDGGLGLTSDHIKYGTSQLCYYLAALFNSMLAHAYIPFQMRVSTLVPIPKNKRKSASDSDNYRAIALSSILGKVFDILVLTKYRNNFSTCDSQFGFKPKHSTAQCVFVANEIIQHYVNFGSNVYAVMLDASKAFDRVEYVKLFEILVERNICPVVIRFLIVMYTCHGIRIKWGTGTSEVCPVSNGVKQGGVLSPLLFTAYIDKLLVQLRESNAGCYIGDTFCGALGYADDLLLLCPTRSSIDRALAICINCAQELNVIFNPRKSKALVFGKRSAETITITFEGEKLEIVESESYLGYKFGANTVNSNVDICIQDFYCRVNMIKSHFKYASLNLKYMLFKTYCMPLYGSQLWDFSSEYVSKFYTAWRKAIRFLLDLPYTTHCDLLHHICCDNRIDIQLYMRFVKFAKSFCFSQNALTRMCYNSAVNGSGSNVSKSIGHLSYLLNVPRESVKLVSQGVIAGLSGHTDSERANASVIRDLISLRYSSTTDCQNNSSSCLTLDEVDYLIVELCTN